MNITWSAPYTLDEVDILGYNLTITSRSNGNALHTFFAQDTWYVINGDGDPCTDVTLSISGYNGAGDGDIAEYNFSLPTCNMITSLSTSGLSDIITQAAITTSSVMNPTSTSSDVNIVSSNDVMRKFIVKQAKLIKLFIGFTADTIVGVVVSVITVIIYIITVIVIACYFKKKVCFTMYENNIVVFVRTSLGLILTRTKTF